MSDDCARVARREFPGRHVRVVIETRDDDLIARLPGPGECSTQCERQRRHVRPEGDLLRLLGSDKIRNRAMRVREHRIALLRSRKRPAVIRVALQQIIGDRVGDPARRLAARRPIEEDRGPPRDLSLKAGELRANKINRKYRTHLRENLPRIANPDDPRTVLNNDCLAPEGYGEIIGGSQREDDYGILLGRIREEGLPEDVYGWYLDLRKYGTFVHSGFGLGVERTVAWICGIPHVREAIAFPRQVHRLRP